MAAKKKGPSLKTVQQRKLQMQKIAKGGPQLSGTKGMSAKPAAPAASKPATPSKPSGRQPRAITNGNSPAMRQIRAKAVQARRQAEGKPVATKGKATTLPNSARAGQNLIKQGAQQLRTIGDSGQVRAAAQRGKQAAEAAKATRGARQAMTRMGGTLARARLTRGPVSAAVGVAADATLSPLARKAGEALGKGPLTKLGRALDRAMPGVNSKDEARLRNAAAAKAGSSSRFKGAREAAVKRAKAIKGSPVVGPRKSFNDTFRDARKAGKKEFTWKGKRYNTKLRGE